MSSIRSSYRPSCAADSCTDKPTKLPVQHERAQYYQAAGEWECDFTGQADRSLVKWKWVS